MTTPIPIPITSIEALRLTCRHCGVAIVMPLAETREVPAKCFNCHHDFPAHTLREFMRDFREMKEVVGRNDVTFMVHLEQAGA